MFELRHAISILSMWVGMDLSPAVTHIPNLENLNLRQEISHLDKNFDRALVNQCDVLSPNTFMKAKKTRDSLLVPIIGQNKKQILYQINLAKAYLAMAIKNSDNFTKQMAEVVKSRHDALAVRAERHFNKAFLETDLILKNLASKIEESQNQNQNQNLNFNSERLLIAQNLKASYRDFELNAMRIETLGPIWKILAQVKRQKWKNSLSAVSEIVINQIKEVDYAIRNNRHDIFEIQKRAMLAQKMVLNLKQLAINMNDCHHHLMDASNLEKNYWQIRCQFLPEEVDVEMIKERNRIIIYLKTSPVIKEKNELLYSDDVLIIKLKKILKDLSIEKIDFFEYGENAKILRKIQDVTIRKYQLFKNYVLTSPRGIKNKKITIGIVLHSFNKGKL